MASQIVAKISFLETLKSLHPKYRWNINNGYSHLLRICLPLIASNISVSAMLFTDRLFLSHYSLDAIAASLPAGAALVTVCSFFQGLIAYVSVFTAQYTGAGQPKRAAACLWQGIYMALISGIITASTFFIAPAIFKLSGHPLEVQALEVKYYQILVIPSFVNLMYFAMSAFLAGMGRTRMVMWVNLFGTIVNIPLAYCFIFGLNFGETVIIKEMGIVGAAIATSIAWIITASFFSILIFNKKMAKSHDIFNAKSFDFTLLKRMFFYGMPGGLQRFLELSSFTFFTFAIGRLGEIYLTANNIVFSIEALSFFPMLGIGASVSILVGQSMGNQKPALAREAVLSGMGISSVYILLIAFLFLCFPAPVLKLFLAKHYDAASSENIIRIGTILLRFVVAYTIFDGFYICCLGALSGAGDVWFPMASMGFSGTFALILPIYCLFRLNMADIYLLWGIFVFYVMMLNAIAAWRYRQGKWQEKKVIEPEKD